MDTNTHFNTASPRGPRLTALVAKADHGDVEAQFDLGVHFGLKLEFGEAARWYRRAADQDHALAQFNLGIMFARGQGMPKDEAAALCWLRKGAEGGDAGSQQNLGVYFHRASVDPQRPEAAESRIEAYKWFQLAAAQGYENSVTSGQLLSLAMTRAEMDEAVRRVAAFSVRRSPGAEKD